MGIQLGKYHVFKRTRPSGEFFYYWYMDNGERVIRSCGHGCDNKRDAVLGKILKRQTIEQQRRHLTKYLIPQFGNQRFSEIMQTAVEDYLLEPPLSNSCRNTVMYTLKVIIREARRAGIVDMVPEFEPFRRNGRRQDVLSSEELAALFPENIDELIRVWRRPHTMHIKPPAMALMFGTLFCVTGSAGLRSGEIRALLREQMARQHSGLPIDRAMDDHGEIGALKKGYRAGSTK